MSRKSAMFLRKHLNTNYNDNAFEFNQIVNFNPWPRRPRSRMIYGLKAFVYTYVPIYEHTQVKLQ